MAHQRDHQTHRNHLVECVGAWVAAIAVTGLPLWLAVQTLTLQ
jgi:hypothetical protein